MCGASAAGVAADQRRRARRPTRAAPSGSSVHRLSAMAAASSARRRWPTVSIAVEAMSSTSTGVCERQRSRSGTETGAEDGASPLSVLSSSAAPFAGSSPCKPWSAVVPAGACRAEPHVARAQVNALVEQRAHSSQHAFFATAGEEDHSLPREMQPYRHDGLHEQQSRTATRQSEACNAGTGAFAGASGRTCKQSLPQLFMRSCASGAHPSALVDEAPSLAAVLLLQPVRKIAAGFEAGGQLRDHVSQEWRGGGSSARSLIGTTGDAPGKINLASVRRCPRLPAW